MRKEVNGYIKLFFIGLAIAGIIWNAAILHNEVKHLNTQIKELQAAVNQIRIVLLDRK